MATPNLGDNTFYKLMLDSSADESAKHEKLLAVFNTVGSKTDINKLQSEYIAWRDFLRTKQKLVDSGITDAKNREFLMEQGLGAANPSVASVTTLHKEQEKKLQELGTANGKLYDLLSIMFSVEGAAKAFRGVASNDTVGLYLEVQAQNTSLQKLGESNSNTQEELLKLSSPPVTLVDPPPAPVPAVAATPKAFALGREILTLNSNVAAPEKAAFRKNSPRMR